MKIHSNSGSLFNSTATRNWWKHRNDVTSVQTAYVHNARRVWSTFACTRISISIIFGAELRHFESKWLSFETWLLIRASNRWMRKKWLDVHFEISHKNIKSGTLCAAILSILHPLSNRSRTTKLSVFEKNVSKMCLCPRNSSKQGSSLFKGENEFDSVTL